MIEEFITKYAIRTKPVNWIYLLNYKKKEWYRCEVSDSTKYTKIIAKCFKNIREALKFIDSNLEDIDWIDLQIETPLTERVIRKYLDRFEWFSICKYQTLSESFIREYKDFVDWGNISQFQKLSKDFKT